MKRYLYAVYDDNNRIVKLYAEKGWAERKASRSEIYRVERYVLAKEEVR